MAGTSNQDLSSTLKINGRLKDEYFGKQRNKAKKTMRSLKRFQTPNVVSVYKLTVHILGIFSFSQT